MPDDRPSSMGAALDAAMAAPEPSPSGDTGAPALDPSGAPAASPAAPDSTPPADPTAAAPTVPPVSGGPTPGPIPYDRFQEVIRTRNDIQKRLDGLSWAQQVPPDVGPRFAAMVQRFQGDPVAFLAELSAEIQAHPEHGPRLRSEAARVLGRGRAANAEPAPDMKVPDPAAPGGFHIWRSAENQQAWLNWHRQQWTADIDKRLAPMMEVTQTVQHERELAARAEEAVTTARETLGELRQRPHFDQYRPAITARFKELMQGRADDATTAKLALHQAYLDVVLPSIQETSKADLLRTLKTQATASTQNPASPTPAPVGKPRSWTEAFAQAGL
jgi:hypothetical protein